MAEYTVVKALTNALGETLRELVDSFTPEQRILMEKVDGLKHILIPDAVKIERVPAKTTITSDDGKTTTKVEPDRVNRVNLSKKALMEKCVMNGEMDPLAKKVIGAVDHLWEKYNLGGEDDGVETTAMVTSAYMKQVEIIQTYIRQLKECDELFSEEGLEEADYNTPDNSHSSTTNTQP